VIMSSKQRIVDVLLDYWNEKRGDRAFPAPNEIKGSELSSVWDSCFIMEVIPQVRQNGYRLVYTGRRLSGDYENDQGTFIKNIVIGFLDSAKDKYEIVVDTKEPLIEEDVVIKPDHDLKFRQILLPLGEGEDVTAIFGGMRLRKDDN